MKRWRMIVASCLLAGFAGLFVYMVVVASTTSPQWTRLIYLFGSAEAIVFAVVGWTFGAEVHRERAVAAERRAEVAEVDAGIERSEKVKLESRALRGEQLAAAIRYETPELLGPERPLAGGQGRHSEGAVQLQRLRALADALFPTSEAQATTTADG